MISGNFKMALTSIKGARWRSTLTMLGIIIGICSVVTIASLGEGLKRQIVGQVNQLGSDIITVRSGHLVNKDRSGNITGVNPLALLGTSNLTDNDVSSIRKLKNVQSVAPLSNITSSASYSGTQLNDVYIVATTADINLILGKHLGFGAYFTNSESDLNYAVIGQAVAERLFKTINPVGSTFQINGTDFVVRGTLENFSGGLFTASGIDLNYAVFVPYTLGKSITDGKAQISQILIKAVNTDDTLKLINDQIKHNHKGQANFTVLKQNDLLNVSGTIVNLFTAFISGIAAISLVVGGIGIMNIMLASVSERTREIGIRKAIGANNRQILNQFFIEGVMLSAIGGLFGIALSYALNFVLRVQTNFNPIITWQILVLAAGVTISLGIIFALAPAVQAARKNPIDALRNE